MKTLYATVLIFLTVTAVSITIRYYPSERFSLTETIIEFLDTAESTVLFVSYSFDEPLVMEKLNKLSKEGLHVEGIVDDSSVFRTLALNPSFKLLCDSSPALIHSKFMVIDDRIGIISTGNFTTSGLDEDSNIILYFESEDIALGLMEFYRAIKKGVKAEGFQYSNFSFYLTPIEGVNELILKKLSDAKESIYFMCYAFTDPRFLAVLKYKASYGVKVKGVVDDWNMSSSPIYEYFSTGIGFRMNMEKWLLHDKTVIVDEKIVITGSANFTRSAWNRNRELVVIIESKEIANQFMKHFNYLWEVSTYDNQTGTGAN
ncbi:phospholipase D-like domain-containing protein [Kosmotoga pacifica]|uniref:phospholipase D n=1 Tax=Kosmotoga pacifica TaxID=1330330 RepID=A0A0G2ZDV1_9BACT|nr:phospholipase D-like domain-containing protein [Kosmotoga pacifica]AKI96973.1 hypothetical protein IX53_03090 [Kosmotoga pacifica]